MRFASWARVLLVVVALELAPGIVGAETLSIDVPRIDRPPELSDFLGMEPAVHLRGKLARAGTFVQRIPDDGRPPSHPTVVYLAYDPEQLYVAFVAFDARPDRVRAHMAPRENIFDDDSVNIMIDTFNDQRRAYTFAVSPLGIQWDAQWTEGQGFDSSWEAVWQSEGARTDRGFVTLLTLPFRALRFPDTADQTWRVMFNRTIIRLGEESFWPRYSNRIEGRLNQAALLTGIRDVSPGRNVQLVPFAFLRNFRVLDPAAVSGPEFEQDDLDEDVGLDAKMIIKDSLVLDATLNPDFSQVESDAPQVTINQRFEVFFPERRPFFLENADVFDTPTNLVFTRRIADPRAGAKLTGKRGRWGIGAMLVDDEAPGEDRGAPELDGKTAYVGVLRLVRDVGEQSKIGVLLTDRELGDGYNRVGAVDGRIKLDENWVAQFQIATAGTRTDAGESSDGTSYNAWIDRSGRHLGLHTHYLYTSPGFRTDLGFLGREQRPNSQNMHHRFRWDFRPEGSAINVWGPRLRLERVLDTHGRRLDRSIQPELEWEWAGDTQLQIGFQRIRERLFPDEFPELSRDRDYAQDRWSVEFETEIFDWGGFGVELDWGDRINFVPPEGEEPALADLLGGRAGVFWRPISPLRLDLTYIRTTLDQPGGGRIFDDEIVRTRANWQFTRELSLRLIAEYEATDPTSGRTSLERRKNVNIDALLRYLLNPWSALYVGYNTNSSNLDLIDTPDGTELVRTRNELSQDGRQLFVKLSYLFQF